jgi:MFS family permease
LHEPFVQKVQLHLNAVAEGCDVAAAPVVTTGNFPTLPLTADLTPEIAGMDAAQLRRSMRLSIAEGALATSMGTLLSGVFLTGFALALGADRLQIGIMAALPALANLAQIFGSYLLERNAVRKSLCVGAVTLGRLIWLPLAAVLVAGWSINHAMLVWWLVGLVAVQSILSSIAGVAWLSWIRDLVPSHQRISFLSRRSQLNSLLAMSLGILGGVFIDYWRSVAPGSIGGFTWVLVFAIVCGLVGAVLMKRIADPGQVRGDWKPFHHLLGQPLKELNFRRVVVFYATWNLSVHVAAPFFAVYMLDQMKLPMWYVTVLATLSSLAGVLANSFWARLSERFGVKPVIFVASLADAFVPLYWLLLGDHSSWWLVLIHLSGVFNAPLAVGPHNIVLKLAPQQNASPYMAVFSAIVGPMSALAAIGGGYLAGAFTGTELAIGPIALGGLKLVFLLSFVGRLASLWLLKKVHEPDAESVGQLIRTLRHGDKQHAGLRAAA